MRISYWMSYVCSSDLCLSLDPLWICPYSADQINTLGELVSLDSMTGFARGDGRAARKSWIWELKSVNGRGLELRFRLPPGFDGIEAEMRALAQSKLVRGNVTLNLQIAETTEDRKSTRLNSSH